MDEVVTQPHNLPILATTEQVTGGTYIVTGSNTGLGLEAAKHLVRLGAAKVIVAVRNLTSGKAAASEIETATGKSNIVEVWELDLAQYASVKAFATRASTELDHIDGLIENAGVSAAQTMAEGHILAVTVNVLSTLLLAVLLFPKMKESAQKCHDRIVVPHIVVVTSLRGLDVAEQWKEIKSDPIVKTDQAERNFLYPLTKLLEIISIRHLAALLPVSRSGVVLNLVCPGFCVTGLSRNASKEVRESIAVMHKKYGRTPDDGSRNLLYAVVAGKESHGSVISDCRIAEDKVGSWVDDEEGIESQKILWEKITTELESIEPGCVKRMLET